MVILLPLLLVLGFAAPAAFAQTTSDLKASGAIQFTPTGISPLALTGTESLLNRFSCRGELHFTSTSKPGGAMVASGVVVMRALDGDQLVGLVSIKTDATGVGRIVFAWREAVQLSNGTILTSTGRFQNDLPDDAEKKVTTKTSTVVIAIIAVLIG
ncbi:MAG: hypothetical protein P4L46_00750 [Fimbriimonas sp.]|nr:hypothetical protein [Fimbriimonas sp.]